MLQLTRSRGEMKYMGGKARLASTIGNYLTTIREPGQKYIEPFIGAASVMCRVQGGQRFAYDAHPDLILMWQALQQGWSPPLEVSEELHRTLRHADPSALRAFVGFACSFGAKFFGGYARAKNCPRGFAAEGASSLAKKLPLLAGVTFTRADYRAVDPRGALVYCDPPYAGTAAFRGVPPFDHVAFWETMREWSRHNSVVISESTAPDDFIAVMELKAVRGLRKPKSKTAGFRREYLFRHRSQC